MTVPAYALLWAAAIGFFGAADQVWTHKIRPWFERRRGWPPLRADEKIPALAWAGSLATVLVILAALPTMGVAAGY